MSKIIQRLNCIEVPEGYLLTWDTAEGVRVIRTTLYGLNSGREFTLESPLTCTGRFLLSPSNYALTDAFKVAVVTEDGEVECSSEILPQKMVKHERLLLKDMRRRANIYMKSSPIGSYTCRVLLRRIDGPACTLCGGASGACSGVGGEAISDHCVSCIGEGVSEPFYVYPVPVLFHGVTPRDDNDVMENPAVQRSHVTRVFQTVFPLPLNAGDILVSGTEVYRIMDQKIPASVGNVPVYYNLTVIKLAPENPKYPLLKKLAYGECDL